MAPNVAGLQAVVRSQVGRPAQGVGGAPRLPLHPGERLVGGLGGFSVRGIFTNTRSSKPRSPEAYPGAPRRFRGVTLRIGTHDA